MWLSQPGQRQACRRSEGLLGSPWLGSREVGKPLGLAALAWPELCVNRLTHSRTTGTWSLLSKGIRCKTSPVSGSVGLCVWMRRQGKRVLDSQQELGEHGPDYGPMGSHPISTTRAVYAVTVTWSWCSETLREELMGRISTSSRFPPETTTGSQ